MKVKCNVEYTTLEGDNNYGNGYPNYIEGVVVTCGKCGRQMESYGTGSRSVKRCMVMLNEACRSNNFYVEE